MANMVLFNVNSFERFFRKPARRETLLGRQIGLRGRIFFTVLTRIRVVFGIFPLKMTENGGQHTTTKCKVPKCKLLDISL
jgi:hypothetical protein